MVISDVIWQKSSTLKIKYKNSSAKLTVLILAIREGDGGSFLKSRLDRKEAGDVFKNWFLTRAKLLLSVK